MKLSKETEKEEPVKEENPERGAWKASEGGYSIKQE